MQSAFVGTSVRGDIPEQKRVALTPFVMPIKPWKRRLAAFIALVEIKEKCRDPLSTRSKIDRMTRNVRIKKIEVGFELLSGRIMENGRILQVWGSKASAGRDPCPQQHQHHVRLRDIEHCGTGAPRRLHQTPAGYRVVYQRMGNVGASPLDQPVAKLFRREAFDQADTRGIED